MRAVVAVLVLWGVAVAGGPGRAADAPKRPNVVLVTGTNLATLLDFVFHTDVPPAEAAQHAAEKGRAALVVTGGPPGGH